MHGSLEGDTQAQRPEVGRVDGGARQAIQRDWRHAEGRGEIARPKTDAHGQLGDHPPHQHDTRALARQPRTNTERLRRQLDEARGRDGTDLGIACRHQRGPQPHRLVGFTEPKARQDRRDAE